MLVNKILGLPLLAKFKWFIFQFITRFIITTGRRSLIKLSITKKFVKNIFSLKNTANRRTQFLIRKRM